MKGLLANEGIPRNVSYNPYIFYPQLFKNYSGLTQIIFPALWNLHLLCRPPFPSEATRIIERFYVNGRQNEDLPALINHHGWKTFKHLERLMVLSGGETGRKLRAAIHYEINLDTQGCRIISLVTKKGKHRNQGYGTLLLFYAILEGKEWGCKKITLCPTRKSAPLYALSGFYSPCWDLESWSLLPLSDKIQACVKTMEIYFDLTDRASMELLSERVHKIYQRN